MKDKGKIFTNRILVLILSLLLYSNISYSSNIFDPYIIKNSEGGGL